MSYQLVYSREKHETLEGVRGKAEGGAFMVLGKDPTNVGEEDEGESGKKNLGGGYTIGGDVSFYEWDFTENMPSKDVE